jgi:cytochrome c
MRLAAAPAVVFTLCLMVASTPAALAQFSPPASPATIDAATLFSRQCGTCHVVAADDGPRQGPNLHGVFGRKAGSLAGFIYSPGYAASGIVWDDAALDAYLINPQALIPGSVMAYRQANADTRKTIIDWLKEQN